MTVVLTDGFDMYNGLGFNTGLQSVWIVYGNITNFSMVGGRYGGQAFNATYYNTISGISRSFPANYTNFAVGVSLKFPAGFSTILSYPLVFSGGGTQQFEIGVSTSGQIGVYRNGTLLGQTATQVIFANTWHHVGVEALISATVGTTEIYVDGISVVNLTGINNKNNGSSLGVDSISLQTTGSGAALYFDDLYVVGGAATWLGEQRVETLRPNSNVSIQWAPSTDSSDYAMVNASVVSGTTFVYASAPGAQDFYGIVPMANTPANINAVNVISFAQKTDASTRTLYNVARSNTTVANSTAFTLAGNYNKFEYLLNNDPATGFAWTAAAVNALNVGPQVAS